MRGNTMKKKKEKFRQPKQKKHRNHHLRFLTKLILLLLLVTVGMGLYYSYQLFFIPVHQEVKSEDKGLTKEQKEVKQEREELEKQEQENKTSIDYIADGSQEKDESVGKISDESDALNALKALQGELGIADVQEEYRVSKVKELEDLTVYEMQQYYEGIEVYGRSLMVSVDESGNLQSVNGTYEQPSNVAVEPEIQEYDAQEAAEAYLKENKDTDSSEDSDSSESSYSLQSQGYVICFNENNAAEAGYLFFVVMEPQNTPVQQIFVSGKTGEILADNSLILTEKVSGTLQGQMSSQTLDYDKQGDEFKLWDEERNIQVYRATASIFRDLNQDSEEVQWKTGETPDAGAVDALANLQKIYAYYQDTFGRKGITNNENDKLYVTVGIQDIQSGTSTTDYRNNAAMFGTDLMIVGEKTDGSATYAANLDIMGHETNHGVVDASSTLLQGVYSSSDKRQKSTQLAIGEGLADIFGEFVEDYSDDGKYNGSCNWYSAVRNMKNPKDIKKEKGILQAKKFKDGKTDCHRGASLISYPTYLMSTGVDGDSKKAISDTKQLATMWYTVIQQTSDKTDFQEIRYLMETRALALASAGQLTNDQVEGVIDSFDEVAIDSKYNYCLTDDSEVIVYGENNKPYDNYRIQVSRRFGEEVLNEEVKSKKLNLKLDAGIYNVVLTDLNNEDLTKKFTLIVNDAKKGQNIYQKQAKVMTQFGANVRDVVLTLDVSGSMGGTPIEETKEAAQKFIDTVYEKSPQTRISIITYSSDAQKVVDFTNDKAKLKNAVSGIYSGGGTNIEAGLKNAYKLIKDEESLKKIVVLMSDGEPTEGKQKDGSYREPILSMANKMKQDNLMVYTLGFFHNLEGENLGECRQLMADIASEGYHYEVSSADSIQFVFDDIAQQVGGGEYVYIKIECPVDVTVQKNGEVLRSEKENQNIRTGFGTLSFDGEKDEIKILRLKKDQNYEICINGTGEGEMDYSIGFVDEDGTYSDMRNFEKIPVTKEMLAVTDTKEGKKTTLQVDENGDGRFEKVYSAKKNSTAVEVSKENQKKVLVAIGIVVLLWMILKARAVLKRAKSNRYCKYCGNKITKEMKFCGECGSPVEIQPLFFEKHAKESKGKRKVKLALIGLLLLFCVSETMIYQTASTKVYRYVCRGNYTLAEKMYDGSVKGHKISQNYLNNLLTYHEKRVKTAYQAGTVNETYLTEIQEIVKKLK